MNTSFSSADERKKKLRSSIKTLFSSLSREKKAELSSAVSENLTSLDEWKQADIVFAFLSMKDEVETALLVEKAFSSGKKVAVPRIEGSDIMFHWLPVPQHTESPGEGNLHLHSYGMFEPSAALPAADIKSLSVSRVLVIVPGLAFDRSCRRLGRGKGYYDRFLSGCGGNVARAGIGFEFQVVDTIPVEEHDELLDMVVTESAVYRCGHKNSFIRE